MASEMAGEAIRVGAKRKAERDEDEEHSEEDDDEYGSGHDDDDHYPESEVKEFQLTVKERVLTLRFSVQKNPDFEQWMHTIHVSCKHNGKIVASAHGQHINRDLIRADFFQDMEGSTRDNANLADEIFDRYGCLKKELKDHPVRKGSGAWGSELDSGKLFVIASIRVDGPEWRRLGLRALMTKVLMKKAESHDGGISFSLMIPGALNNDELNSEVRGKSRKDAFAIRLRHLRAAYAFWRSLGFRRVGSSAYFGFATDSAHKAHKLAPAADYDPDELSPYEVGHESDEDDSDGDSPLTHEEWKEKCLERMKKIRPVHHAIMTLPDAQCMNFFKAWMTAKYAADPGWTQIDSAHNNVLHVAASLSKPQTVEWLLRNVDKDSNLRSARNLEGYTPLEALQTTLETLRNTLHHGSIRICISDRFRGYSADSISCMKSLKEMSNISGIQALRMKYGCTCGECLMGFMSPRMKLVLLTETEMIYEALSDDTNWKKPWREAIEHYMDHLPPVLKQKFRTSKSLRRGFANIFDHAADCLRQNMIPTEANVLEEWSNSGQWSAATRNFLVKGGKIEHALRKVFDEARDHDDKAGDAFIMELLEEDILALPKCRNDHEFSFVALACGIANVFPIC